MPIKYTVVHGGAAHRDDYLAVGLALAHGLVPLEAPVYRRDPTKEELEDREVLVIDVGDVHDPMKSNFDHHQLPRGAKDCALSLMARFFHDNQLGLTYHELWQNEPWYKFTIILDSLGPVQAAKEIGLPELPELLWSPIEAATIESMQGYPELQTSTKELMTMVAHRLINSAVEFRRQMAWLQENVRWVPMSDFFILWAECSKPMGFHKVREKSGKDVPVSVNFDDRGPGMCLYRFDDDKRIDFSKLDGHKDVVFAHKGGFIAKTARRMTEKEVLELIELALTT